jgi:hypothetical protein
MPVIQPVRLKAQASRLAKQFTQPRIFTHGFNELMEIYADHTYRHGQAGEPPPMLSSFNIPLPVIRQVWLEILPLISSHPQAALELCDNLWQQPILEHRILATQILGQLSIKHRVEVIKRIKQWAKQKIEDRLVDILLEYSLTTLRSQAHQEIAELVDYWLSSHEPLDKSLGLRLLQSLASDAAFDDLPMIYRLITPFLRTPPPQLKPEIVTIVNTLIHRSAPEVAYLLHQNLSSNDNTNTAWIIRQVITEFPPELQAGLFSTIRKK